MEDKDMLEGLGTKFYISANDATKLASELWGGVLRETDDYTNAIITMRQYMELISHYAKGFCLDDGHNALQRQTIWIFLGIRYYDEGVEYLVVAIHGCFVI